MAGTPKSCTSCRQAKVGCDARKKPPNTPCTRCSKNQLECRFDKNFKRIRTRKLTANLTNELHQLRMSQAALAGDQSSQAAIRLREPELPPAPSSFFYTTIAEPLSDFTTGDVTISLDTITELIQHFGRQYHVHAHFVQPIESLAAFYATSPLLFWTIILVSSHFHPQHSDLFDQLLLPHEELLKPLSNTAIQSIHEIQALLLLCLWPTPKRQEWASPTWNYICLAVASCMRLDLDKTDPLDLTAPRLSPLGQKRKEEMSLRTRKLTWLACLAISTQEATFLGLLPPLSSRPHLKRCRRAIEEVKDHLAPGFRPKYAIHELMCNYCLVLEEVDGSSSQLSLVEMFDGSLDCLRQTYAAEWNNHVDVMFQYARLNLNATALMRIVIENAGDCSHYLTDIQTLMIRGTEASFHMINDAKTILSEALPREGQPGCMPMPICYPRAYFEQIFFAAVFIFRTSFIMRPSTTTNRDAALRGLIEVYNIYQLFPRHPDTAVGMEIIQHILRYVGSEDFSYEAAPLGGLVRTNRLGASFVWDTLTGLIQLSADEKFVDKRYHHERGYREDQGSRMSQSTGTDLAASSSASSSVVQGPVIQQQQQQQQQEEVLDTTATSSTTGGLPLPINLDWGDIDLALPTFDIFGLDAGEHIAW